MVLVAGNWFVITPNSTKVVSWSYLCRRSPELGRWLQLRYQKPTRRKRVVKLQHLRAALEKSPHDHSLWLATTRFHWYRYLLTSVIHHLLVVIQVEVLQSVPSLQSGLSSSKWRPRIRLKLQDQVMLLPRIFMSLFLLSWTIWRSWGIAITSCHCDACNYWCCDKLRYSDKRCGSSFKGKWCVVKHDVPSDPR